MVLVQFVVPQGAMPGTMVQVPVGNQLVMIAVPPGAQPGQTLQVEIAEPTAATGDKTANPAAAPTSAAAAEAPKNTRQLLALALFLVACVAAVIVLSLALSDERERQEEEEAASRAQSVQSSGPPPPPVLQPATGTHTHFYECGTGSDNTCGAGCYVTSGCWEPCERADCGGEGAAADRRASSLWREGGTNCTDDDMYDCLESARQEAEQNPGEDLADLAADCQPPSAPYSPATSSRCRSVSQRWRGL